LDAQVPAVHDFIALARRRRKMSQRTLSARIGRSPAYVSKVEAGQLDPGLRGFAAIVVALELSPMESWILLRLEAARGLTVTAEIQNDGMRRSA